MTPPSNAASVLNVANRLAAVRRRIDDAAERAGRDPKEVRLVAVSKRHPFEAVEAAYAAGHRDFGESYAQELCDKAERGRALAGLRWHMIGHVQSNKVGKLLGAAHVLHSLDRASLVREIDKRSVQGTAPLDVLVQVNVAAEAQKSGCDPAQLDELLAAVEQRPRCMRLVGLMTMPPQSDDPTVAKRVFDELRRLRDEHGGVERLPQLSMGMSDDLEAAVLAGATMVRIGTAIFGERPT